MADRVPLQYPLYGATFGEAVGRFWRKYAVFSGRASRSEYWWAALFVSLISLAVTLVLSIVYVVLLIAAIAPAVRSDGTLSPAGVTAIVWLSVSWYAAILVVQLPVIVPSYAAQVRRLHDAGFSGLLALLNLVPYGGIATTVMCILDSKPEGARFDLPPAPAEPSPQPTTGSDPDASATIRS